MSEKYEAPDLSDVPIPDLCQMMIQSGMLNDMYFVKACRDELAKRKPPTATPQGKI